MIKLVGCLIITVLCAFLAVIPEIVMYFSWNLINPESELTRMLLIIAFWFGGAGFCFVFAFLGLALWTALMTEVLK